MIVSLLAGCSRPPEVPAESSKPAKSGGPVSGSNWTSPSTGMEFVWIESIEIWVGKYEVTNREYRKKKPEHDSGSYRGHSLDRERQPVVRVNFNDAKDYAFWLTRRDRDALSPAYRYRLPSEDEWLKFARCGEKREYPWGDEWPPQSSGAGNYRDESGKREFGWDDYIDGYDDGHPVTAPVDELWSSPWGLYGVGGNVWEACASDESGQQFGAWRGSSWYYHLEYHQRLSHRYADDEDGRFMCCGFRLVLSP